MDSVTWLVLLRESVDWERYRRPLIGISSNIGLNGKKLTTTRIHQVNRHTDYTVDSAYTHSLPSNVAYGETFGEVVAMESHDAGVPPRWWNDEGRVVLWGQNGGPGTFPCATSWTTQTWFYYRR